ncbi:MAG TPA: hypothetical protein PLE32_03540 [Haliscomenobacter sp.]|nr:hypothetical protein [Haliscomenobacter sp.]
MKKNKSITNWLVNIQHNPTSKNDPQDRDWRDMVKYGFWGANGESSREVSNGNVVRKLSIGDQIFAYSSAGNEKKKNGFVGHGIVQSDARMAKNFTPNGFGGKNLFELPLECSYMKVNEKYPVDDEHLGEWVIGIQWIKTFTIENPIYKKGLYVPLSIACKIDWRQSSTKPKLQATIEFLKTNLNAS